MKNLWILLAPAGLLATTVTGTFGHVGWPLVRVVCASLLALALLCAVLVGCQGRIIFPRTRRPLSSWSPAGGIEECRFETADGLTLHGWWHAGYGPNDPGVRPVLLWCHGNAGNITHRESNLLAVARHGMAAFLFDYRGYGKSEGKPSEPGLYLDAAAAYRYLTEERGIEPGRIVCFGRSLGAAVALDLALREDVAGLVMESAFENIRAMARVQAPLLPVGRLLRSRFDNLARVGTLGVPLFMLHGDRDRIVPIGQGRAVFAAAPEPKVWHVIEGAGHNDTLAVGGEDYLRVLHRFCYEHAGASPTPG